MEVETKTTNIHEDLDALQQLLDKGEEEHNKQDPIKKKRKKNKKKKN